LGKELECITEFADPYSPDRARVKWLKRLFYLHLVWI